MLWLKNNKGKYTKYVDELFYYKAEFKSSEKKNPIFYYFNYKFKKKFRKIIYKKKFWDIKYKIFSKKI